LTARLAIPALALLAGCSDHRILLVTGAPWTSAIVGVVSGQERAITAYEGGGAIRFEAASPDLEVIAVLYAVPLSDLELSAGPIDVSAAETRPLPAPFLSALALAVVDDDVTSTELLPNADPRLERLRLPEIEGPYCESSQRCLEITQANRCTTACDPPADPAMPKVSPPAAPALPVPPEAAVIACPWAGTTCRPPAPAAPISLCALTGWPVGITRDHPVRWINPEGGLGPNGESIYSTIPEALRGAPSDVVLALAAGTHVGSFDLVGTQALIGACAASTFVDGGTIRGDVTIADVSAARLIEVAPGAKLDAQDLVFTGSGRAIDAQPGSRVAIARMVAESAGPELMVSDGALIDARDLVVASSTTGALVAIGGGTIRLQNASLQGTEAHARSGGRLELTDVTLGADARRIGAFDGLVVDGATLAASRVSFDRAFRVAVLARNGHARMQDVLVRDAASASRAAVLDFSRGSTLALDRASFESFDGFGIWLYSGAVGRISHVRIRGAHIDEMGAGLAGVRVETSAKLSLDHAEISGIRGIGVEIRSAGTATVSDLVVTGVAVHAFDGRAVEVQENGALVLHRARIDDFHRVGIRTVGSGARSVLSDIDVSAEFIDGSEGILTAGDAHCTVDRARIRGDLNYLFGIASGASGTARDLTLIAGQRALDTGAMLYLVDAVADISRVSIEGAPNAFISAFRSRVTLSDVTVVAQHASPDARVFPAIDLGDDDVTLSRVRLVKCNGPAVWANGGTVTIEDLEIDGTGAPTDATREHSVSATARAQLTIRRMISHDVLGAIVSAFNIGTRVEVTDLLGQRTGDAGARSDQGAMMVLERVRFEDTVGNGIWASKGGDVMGKDVRVSRVERGRQGQGFGLAVSSGSSATLEQFAIEAARDSGVRINLDIEGGPTTIVRLIDGLISGSRAGLSAPVETASVELTRVRFRDNQIARE